MVDSTLLVEGGNNLPSILKEGFLVEVEDSTFDNNNGCEAFDTCITASQKESDGHIVKHVRHFFFAVSPRK